VAWQHIEQQTIHVCRWCNSLFFVCFSYFVACRQEWFYHFATNPFGILFVRAARRLCCCLFYSQNPFSCSFLFRPFKLLEFLFREIGVKQWIVRSWIRRTFSRSLNFVRIAIVSSIVVVVRISVSVRKTIATTISCNNLCYVWIRATKRILYIRNVFQNHIFFRRISTDTLVRFSTLLPLPLRLHKLFTLKPHLSVI